MSDINHNDCKKKHEMPEEEMEKLIRSVSNLIGKKYEKIQDKLDNENYCQEIFLNIMINSWISITGHILRFLTDVSGQHPQKIMLDLIVMLESGIKIINMKVPEKKEMH